MSPSIVVSCSDSGSTAGGPTCTTASSAVYQPDQVHALEQRLIRMAAAAYRDRDPI